MDTELMFESVKFDSFPSKMDSEAPSLPHDLSTPHTKRKEREGPQFSETPSHTHLPQLWESTILMKTECPIEVPFYCPTHVCTSINFSKSRSKVNQTPVCTDKNRRGSTTRR